MNDKTDEIKVLGYVERTFNRLNTYFNTKNFILNKEFGEKAIEIFLGEYKIYSVPRGLKEYNSRKYNFEQILSESKDKIESLCYNQKIPYFFPWKVGQRAVILIGASVGKKVYIREISTYTKMCKVSLKKTGPTIDIDKTLLGLI